MDTSTCAIPDSDVLPSRGCFIYTEAVVAESVVVIKKLLQMGEKREFPLEDVVTHLAKLLPNVKVPKARASIVWVIGEYHHTIPLRAPDILRTLAKSFTEEVSPNHSNATVYSLTKNNHPGRHSETASAQSGK